jgi:hypothetical protein
VRREGIVGTRLQKVALVFLFSIFAMVMTTPVHEACHWVMSDVDPYIEPTEFHVFDARSIESGQNVLSSYLGYVVVKESYSGAFVDRPAWADLLQEIICLSIQIILTCIIVLKIVTFVEIKPSIQRFFLFHPVEH